MELQPVQDGTTPVERRTMMPFPQTKAGPRYHADLFLPMEIDLFCTCQIHMMIWSSVTRVGTGTTSSV